MTNNSEVNNDELIQHTFNKIPINENEIVHKNKRKVNNIHYKHNKNSTSTCTTYA